MVNNITNSFRTQWSDDVKHAYQQADSRLRPACRVVTGVEGNLFKFNKLAAVAANTKSRNAELTFIDPDHTVATATLADAYAPILLDKLDMNKVMRNGDMRREYVMATANAIRRKVDDDTITAMAVPGNTITTTAGGLTFPKLLESVEELNSNDVDPGERYIVVGAAQISEALAIEQLTSADYSNLLAVQQGQVKQALGYTWIMSNRLPVATSVRTCFAFHKNAVGIAFGDDVQTEINYVPERAAFLVTSMVAIGSVVIEDAGIIEIPCAE